MNKEKAEIKGRDITLTRFDLVFHLSNFKIWKQISFIRSYQPKHQETIDWL